MTRDEYEKIIMDRESEKRKYEMDLLMNYNKTIRPLDIQRTDTQCHIRDAQYSESYSLLPQLNFEVNNLTNKILNLEKENDSDSKQKIIDDLENEISSLKANARIELNPWEYHTSSIISDEQGLQSYLRSYGIKKVETMRSYGLISLYMLTSNFDYECGAYILEKISPYLGPSNTVLYIPDNAAVSNIHLEYVQTFDLWRVVMDNSDVLMEDKQCDEVLQYFNLIR